MIQDFPITQDSLDFLITVNAITELEDNKSDTHKLRRLDPDPETAATAAHQKRLKELMERRFTHT